MTYREVVDKIENIRRFGNLTGVEITAQMLEQLGDPQEGMNLIHIAGTNGKGSVSAFLCAMLREAGLRVGTFVSPHLVDFRERICVDGRMIEKEAVSRIGSELLNREFAVHPTMFDYCLVMALLYFKEQQCDVVILETGLGGRCDSTNAVGIPAVTVITKIGYDHMAILGDTLEEIASEKAGIIKAGTHLVVESQTDAVQDVFAREAKRVGVAAYEVIEPDTFLDCRYEDGMQMFSFGTYQELKMHMLGVHQYENAAAAILAAEAFLKSGVVGEFTKEQVHAAVCGGVSNARWQGRMEILRKEPFLLVDGAHNSNGVEALKRSLMALFPGEKFHFVMGVMADKDYEKMVEELLPLAVDFKTMTVEYERSLASEALAECIREKGIPAQCEQELRACLAPENCDGEHKTIAFGSLYFIGEIEAIFRQE